LFFKNTKDFMWTYMLVMCIYKCVFNIIVENIVGLKECFSQHYLYQVHTKVKLNLKKNLSPMRRGFVPSFVNYKKGCTRLAAASDKV
jgi:hypothetical protein